MRKHALLATCALVCGLLLVTVTIVWRRQHRELSNLRSDVRGLCINVGIDLGLAVEEWKGLHPYETDDPLASPRYRYLGRMDERRRIVAICLGSYDAALACIPTDLTAETVDAVQRGADALENGHACR